MGIHRHASVLAIAAILSMSHGLLSAAPRQVDNENGWQAGFARTVITPKESMWLTGYGARTKASEGKIHDLYARAAALRGPHGKTVVVLATDLLGIPKTMAEVVSEAVRDRHGIERADLMLTASHTHCGPALDQPVSHMLAMTEDDWQQVRRYQQDLNAKVIDVIGKAIENLQPARLTVGTGEAGFATNRRPPLGEGPVDHDVPVLRVTTPDGSALLGVIFGYACHNTTLNVYRWCGDYAGFAALYLEDRHPGCTALFFSGCGGDQNPHPRRELELAEKYGRLLGVAVEDVLDSQMDPVDEHVRTAFRTIDLEFESVPTREELTDDLDSDDRYRRQRARYLLDKLQQQGELSKSYPYPIQVWRFGDRLTWVALGGEVVVEYSLRLKRELGAQRTWVTAYANDVMAYIPSEKVLREGGYEGASSMIVYQQPSTWKPGLEDRIVTTVLETAAGLRKGTAESP